MLLDAPTFVVQRRINRPLTDVQRGLADRRALVPAAPLDPVSEGFMHLHEPLRPVAPFSSRQPAPSWCARAYLLTARQRLVATVEIEVSMWSRDATSLTLRPVARHPERWRPWRLRQYFALAHLAADATARLVAQRAVSEAEASAYAARTSEPVDPTTRQAASVGTRA
ncbi:MAG: hypothetical protein QOH10_2371 [Actinomycetota bacterium]|nr:hypothetical protein [Actinomycetota bacterium]